VRVFSINKLNNG